MLKLISIFRDRLRGSRGFTLIELLVVMLTAGIIAGAMLGLYAGVMRSFADTGNRIVNQDDARTAVNQMSRYIRMASVSASNLTSVSDAIALASPQELVFYADINGQGQPEKVRYYLVGKTMKMASVAPDASTSPPSYPAYTTDGVVVMNGIQNGATAIFTYYQMNPNYLTNPIPSNDNLVVMANPTDPSALAKILAVGVTLYVNEAPKVSKGNVRLDSLAQIRQRYNGGLSGS
jgi:prepilin-type N-terminal cleavage/methylation domain-containing protein